MACNFSCSSDHFHHRIAVSAAQVEDIALSSVPEILKCKNMRPCQVLSVYVVAYACAILSRVVVAVDGDVFAFSERYLQNQGD